ncbi:hypothetical protein PTKIN_Ptkin16aG0527100 [Pterospermum kingtungense]
MAYFLIFSLLFSLVHVTSSVPSIGVTYNPPSAIATVAVQPPLGNISAAITTLKITSVRLLNPDPYLIKAFAFTNTTLLLSIPNPLLPPLASSFSLALHWLNRHVLPFYPRSNITLISVGNCVLSSSTTQEDLSPYLLRAMRNIHRAMEELGIGKIPISTTFSFFSTITTAFPPSSAEFQQPVGDIIIKPLLQFLEETNSFFLINLYPYNMFRLNSQIPIGFALFQENPFNFRDDLVTGVRYFNLFDMMVDAVVAAMVVMGHANVPVIVTETGWPSGGGEAGELEANRVFAEMYLKGLVKHLRSGVGTPLRKEGVAEVYVYELMDHKEGDMESSRKWGIVTQDMTMKYDVEFSIGARNSGSLMIFLVIMWFSWQVIIRV